MSEPDYSFKFQSEIYGQLCQDRVVELWEARDNGTEEALLRKWKIEELEGRLHQLLFDQRSRMSAIEAVGDEIARLKAIP